MKTLLDVYRENGHLEECNIPEEVLKTFTFPEEGDVDISDPNLREAIYSVFKGKCPSTGEPIRIYDMVIDHIIPSSKGGPDNVFNYALTKQWPNSVKKDFLDVDAVLGALYAVRKKAEKVLQMYLQIKQGKQRKKLTPQERAEREAVKVKKREVKEVRRKIKEEMRLKMAKEGHERYISELAKEIENTAQEDKATLIELLNCPFFPDGSVVMCNQNGFDGKINVAEILSKMVVDGDFNKLSEADIANYRCHQVNPYHLLGDNWAYNIAKHFSTVVYVSLRHIGYGYDYSSNFIYIPSNLVVDELHKTHFKCLDGGRIVKGLTLETEGGTQVIVGGLKFKVISKKAFEELQKRFNAEGGKEVWEVVRGKGEMIF